MLGYKPHLSAHQPFPSSCALTRDGMLTEYSGLVQSIAVLTVAFLSLTVTLSAAPPSYFRGFTLIALKENREGDKEEDHAGTFQEEEEEEKEEEVKGEEEQEDEEQEEEGEEQEEQRRREEQEEQEQEEEERGPNPSYPPPPPPSSTSEVGQAQIIDEEETQFMSNCPVAVTESTPRRRTRIQVFWIAPPTGTGCVIL
ncbi:hypothetical protein A6R68_19567, partial [Neotoma lepida]